MVADQEALLPSVSARFVDDYEACIMHERMSISRHRAARPMTVLERLSVEEQRQHKVIPDAFGEKPVPKLKFGALIRAVALAYRPPSSRSLSSEKRLVAQRIAGLDGFAPLIELHQVGHLHQ